MEIEIDVYVESNGFKDIRHEKITEDDLKAMIRRWYVLRDWKYKIEDITVTKINM